MYWLDSLVCARPWPDVARVAQAALDVIPYGVLRAQAASILISAGEQLRNDDLTLMGKRERFRSFPTAVDLAALLEEAGRQAKREEVLEDALTFLRGSKGITDELLITALLMGGRLDEARQRVKSDRPLGWSSQDRVGPLSPLSWSSGIGSSGPPPNPPLPGPDLHQDTAFPSDGNIQLHYRNLPPILNAS